MNTHQAIEVLLNQEESLEDQLDLLTAIGLGTGNEDTFKASEDIRYAIVSMGEKNRETQGDTGSAVLDSVESREVNRGHWQVGAAEGTEGDDGCPCWGYDTANCKTHGEPK